MIIETDLGHDPDDFFTLCYLLASGVKLDAILITPGDPDQISIAKFLCKQLNLDIPIGASLPNRSTTCNRGVHTQLLNKYHFPLCSQPDGLSRAILRQVVNEDSEFLIIGPVTGIGTYLEKNPINVKKATMQGGFLPYHIHNIDCVKLEKFRDKSSVPTFNLNGNRPAGLSFLESKVAERRMVGKNVCHTIIFYESVLDRIKPRCRASELFVEAAQLYFGKHKEKAFHDPLAAVCHLHPEIGTWFRGRTIKMGSGWSTVSDPVGDYILADVDREKFWDHIINFK